MIKELNLLLLRCGMVYVDPDDLRWKPVIETWLNDYSDKLKMKDETKVWLGV